MDQNGKGKKLDKSRHGHGRVGIQPSPPHLEVEVQNERQSGPSHPPPPPAAVPLKRPFQRAENAKGDEGAGGTLPQGPKQGESPGQVTPTPAREAEGGRPSLVLGTQKEEMKPPTPSLRPMTSPSSIQGSSVLVPMQWPPAWKTGEPRLIDFRSKKVARRKLGRGSQPQTPQRPATAQTPSSKPGTAQPKLPSLRPDPSPLVPPTPAFLPLQSSPPEPFEKDKVELYGKEREPGDETDSTSETDEHWPAADTAEPPTPAPAKKVGETDEDSLARLFVETGPRTTTVAAEGPGRLGELVTPSSPRHPSQPMPTLAPAKEVGETDKDSLFRLFDEADAVASGGGPERLEELLSPSVPSRLSEPTPTKKVGRPLLIDFRNPEILKKELEEKLKPLPEVEEGPGVWEEEGEWGEWEEWGEEEEEEGESEGEEGEPEEEEEEGELGEEEEILEITPEVVPEVGAGDQETLPTVTSDEEFKGDPMEALRELGLPIEGEKDLDVLNKLTRRGVQLQADRFDEQLFTYWSPTLRSYCLYNTTDNYKTVGRFEKALKAIKCNRLKVKEQEIPRQQANEDIFGEAHYEKMRAVTANEEHFEFIRGLSEAQAVSMPFTIMRDMLEEMVPSMQLTHRYYAGTAVTFFNTLLVKHTGLIKRVGEAYARMKIKFEMYDDLIPNIYEGEENLYVAGIKLDMPRKRKKSKPGDPNLMEQLESQVTVVEATSATEKIEHALLPSKKDGEEGAKVPETEAKPVSATKGLSIIKEMGKPPSKKSLSSGALPGATKSSSSRLPSSTKK